MPIIRTFKEIDPKICVPVIKSIAKSLQHFAETCEYNDACTLLQKLLSLQHRSISTDESAFLCVVNELVSTYFMKNNFKQASNVLNIVMEKGINLEDFEQGEIAEFHYNRGKVSAIMCKIFEATRIYHKHVSQHESHKHMNQH